MRSILIYPRDGILLSHKKEQGYACYSVTPLLDNVQIRQIQKEKVDCGCQEGLGMRTASGQACFSGC